MKAGASVNVKLEKMEEEGKDFAYFQEMARKFNEEQARLHKEKLLKEQKELEVETREEKE